LDHKKIKKVQVIAMSVTYHEQTIETGKQGYTHIAPDRISRLGSISMFQDLEDPTKTFFDPENNKESIEYINMADMEATYRSSHVHEVEAAKCNVLKLRGGEKIADLTGYNTTPPIYDKHFDPETGEPYFILGVRMEPFDDELDSRIEYFRASSPFSLEWDHIDDESLANIRGQDPSVTDIDGQLFLGVVEVESHESEDGLSSETTWRTAFYQGSSITEMNFFGYGPPGMKDIRNVQLTSNEVVTFTRPQSEDPEKGGRGQIGEVTTNSVELIKNPEVLQNAELINTRFMPEEWGGINFAVALEDGKIGVIGHIASFDVNNPAYAGLLNKPKIYHPFSGIYDPISRKIIDIEILAMASEFSGVIPKTELLKDVAFGTGITEPDLNGNVMLLLGIGDSVTGSKMIKDPFAGKRLPKK
jgi:hypothetical protein